MPALFYPALYCPVPHCYPALHITALICTIQVLFHHALYCPELHSTVLSLPRTWHCLYLHRLHGCLQRGSEGGHYTVCTVHSVHCTMYIVQQCTVYNKQCTVYTSHSAQCPVLTWCGCRRTVYSTQYTVYSTQCTVYSTHYKVYSSQYTVYSTQYTVYTTHLDEVLSKI